MDRFQLFSQSIPSLSDIMLSPTGSSSEIRSINSSTDRPLQQQRSLFRSLAGFGRNRQSSINADDVEYEEFPQSSHRRLSTFSGVFAPVCLSMFSAILFLRLGFAVGYAGFLLTLGLFAIAYVIVTCTVFSVCAISTNGAVESGGAYYMISRALGPEFGGAIGLLFFFANICSGALYVSGAVETLINSFGPGGSLSDGGLLDGRWYSFVYGAVICVFNMGVCVVGASMFAYMSAFILAVVATAAFISFLSFFINSSELCIDIPRTNQFYYGSNATDNITYCEKYTGLSKATFANNTYPHFDLPDYTSGMEVDTATVFAVLFNGVTGIMSGANVAGELKNPAKAIPRGTLSGLATTAVVYTTIVVLTAFSCTNDLLRNNYTFMQAISVWAPSVDIGVLAATLSAAMTNLMGASRVLLAVSRDKLFGSLLSPFAKTTSSGNPIPAVLLSFLLTVIVLLIPSLNQIARITSIFFLLSYFGNNLACLAMELASAPNWRPKYNFFSWHTAFLGMCGCGVMMFIISPIYAAVSFAVALLLMLSLHFWSPDINWGSISQALIFHQVRKYLLLLDIRKEHVKFWRPQVLLLVSRRDTADNLVDFINDLKKGGLYMIGHVKKGSFEDLEVDPLQEEYSEWLEYVDRLRVKAFVELTMARTVREGLHHLVHLSGLGGMKPNTIILGFPRYCNPTIPSSEFVSSPFSIPHQPPGLSSREFVQILRDCLRMRKNVCIARNFQTFDKRGTLQSGPVQIDVWPVDLMRPSLVDNYDTSALFLMQLATVLQMTSTWRRRSTLRVFLTHRQQTDNVLKRVRTLNNLLGQLRIQGKVVPVVWDDAMQHIDRSTTASYVDSSLSNEVSSPVSEMQPYSLPEGYVHAVQRLLRFHSQTSALTFLYMPRPPSDVTKSEVYMDFLESISSLPSPALLVHGISIVTSTTI